MKNEAGYSVCSLTRADRKALEQMLADLTKGSDEADIALSENYNGDTRSTAAYVRGQLDAFGKIMVNLGWKVRDGKLVMRMQGRMYEYR